MTTPQDFTLGIGLIVIVLSLGYKISKPKEAKIDEVLKLCDENFFSKEPKGKLMENIENLPTDRITTEP